MPEVSLPQTPRFMEELLQRSPLPRSSVSRTPSLIPWVYDPGSVFQNQNPRPHPTSRFLSSERSPRESGLLSSPRTVRHAYAEEPFALLGREMQLSRPGGASACGSTAQVTTMMSARRAEMSPRPSPPSSINWRGSPHLAGSGHRPTPAVHNGEAVPLNAARVPFPSLRHARHLERLVPPVAAVERQPPANRDESALRHVSVHSLHPRLHDERLSRLYSAKAAHGLSPRAHDAVGVLVGRGAP